MSKTQKVAYIIGPDGSYIDRDSLPTQAYKRWSLNNKANIVFAIEAGLITPKHACHKYEVTRSQLKDWYQRIEYQYGDKGRVIGIHNEAYNRNIVKGKTA